MCGKLLVSCGSAGASPSRRSFFNRLLHLTIVRGKPRFSLRHHNNGDARASGLTGTFRKVRPSPARRDWINRRHRHDSCPDSTNVRVAGRSDRQPSRPCAWIAVTIAPECQRLPSFPNGFARRVFPDRQAPRGRCLRPQKPHRSQKSRVLREPFSESRKLRARVAEVQGPGAATVNDPPNRIVTIGR